MCSGEGDMFGNKNNKNPCMISGAYILGGETH